MSRLHGESWWSSGSWKSGCRLHSGEVGPRGTFCYRLVLIFLSLSLSLFFFVSSFCFFFVGYFVDRAHARARLCVCVICEYRVYYLL